jgi:hypothetical protein
VKRLLFLLCLALGLMPCTDLAEADVNAKTLADLVESDQLRLRSWLEPATGIVVGQEVQLTIEVSTRRWFAGGTTIRHPDEKNLVILRRDDFANNLSRREGAVTWVIQRWNLELYPQAAGTYHLPPIQLELAVNDATAGVVRGTLLTEPIEFQARVPAALANAEDWVATPTLTLEHSLDRETTGLVPGDAFTRKVSLRASHVTAMMLPPVQASELPGLPAYEDPPQLRDISNRGQATAERSQSITYVVEQSGQYSLPEQVFYWWDTVNGELKTVVLPELTIDAGAAVSETSDDAPAQEAAQLLQEFPRYWLLAAALGFTIVVAALLWRRRARSISESQLLRQVSSALRRGNNEAATRLLYRWLNIFRPQPDWYQLREALVRTGGPDAARQVDTLLAHTYGDGKDAPGSLQLERVRPEHASWLSACWRKLKPPPVDLKINPDDIAAG